MSRELLLHFSGRSLRPMSTLTYDDWCRSWRERQEKGEMLIGQCLCGFCIAWAALKQPGFKDTFKTMFRFKEAT